MGTEITSGLPLSMSRGERERGIDTLMDLNMLINTY